MFKDKPLTFKQAMRAAGDEPPFIEQLIDTVVYWAVVWFAFYGLAHSIIAVFGNPYK